MTGIKKYKKAQAIRSSLY